MHEEIKRTYRGVTLAKGVKEHQDLLDTIRGGDEEKAATMLRGHIGSVREKLRETMPEREP